MEGASCEVKVEVEEECVEGRTGDRTVPSMNREKRMRRISEETQEKEEKRVTRLVVWSGVHFGENGHVVQNDCMAFWLDDVPSELPSNTVCFENNDDGIHEPHTMELRERLGSYAPDCSFIEGGARRAVKNAYWEQALEVLREEERADIMERQKRGDEVAPAMEAYNRAAPLQEDVAAEKAAALSVEELKKEVETLDLVCKLDQEFSTLFLPEDARFATSREVAKTKNADTVFVTVVYSYVKSRVCVCV